MNKVILIGRLTKDVDMRTTQSQISNANFSIAVDRRFKDNNENKQTDFINCVAWRQTADFIGKYFKKGNKIGVVGQIQSRSYEKEGKKVYVTEVLVEEAYFVDSAQNTAQSAPAPQESAPLAPDMNDAEKGVERIQARLQEDREIEQQRKDMENMELPFDF